MPILNIALRFCDKFLFLKDGLIFASGDRSVINAATIKEVFHLETIIHSITGIPIVITV